MVGGVTAGQATTLPVASRSVNTGRCRFEAPIEDLPNCGSLAPCCPTANSAGIGEMVI
jgi:hypothetical protein